MDLSMSKAVEEKVCRKCGDRFSVAEWDREFLSRMELPSPQLCPECRQQRRLAHLNQINLFKRRCDATGKMIVANYAPENPVRVFDQAHWYSDAFDGTVYGRDYDFSKPFFEQFHQLSLEVPRPALFTDYLKDENSAYTNCAGKNKNCYLLFDSDENWDCLYSFGINSCKNTIDCYRAQKLELCYETVDSTNCYNCSFVFNSDTCHESLLLSNCIGCKNCILCSNLRHKQYYFRNEEVSPEEYRQITSSISSHQTLQKYIDEFKEFRLQFPQRYMRGVHNENVAGDHLVHSKNAYWCFDSMYLWDTKYCHQAFISLKDSLDISECGQSELMYDSCNTGYNAYNVRFALHCLSQVTNLTYCHYCFNGSKNLFGCVGLKRKEYCILNKEYSKDDYSALLERIKAHMQSTGEWGENLPIETSLQPYNLSMAGEHYPLSREEALSLGYLWKEREERDYLPQSCELPDDIESTGDEILNETLACIDCGKNYKLIAQELEFYRQQRLPVPRTCFNCRYLARRLGRTPRYLWQRACDACGSEIMSAYAPRRPEKVFCEQCYVESLT